MSHRPSVSSRTNWLLQRILPKARTRRSDPRPVCRPRRTQDTALRCVENASIEQTYQHYVWQPAELGLRLTVPSAHVLQSQGVTVVRVRIGGWWPATGHLKIYPVLQDVPLDHYLSQRSPTS